MTGSEPATAAERLAQPLLECRDVARWTIGSTYDVSNAAAVLEMASAAAGPVAAAAISRRDHERAQVVGASELLGVTPAMRDVMELLRARMRQPV